MSKTEELWLNILIQKIYPLKKKIISVPKFINDGILLLILDTNVFLTVLEKNWHIHRLIESIISEKYHLICLNNVRQELIRLQASNKRAKNALRLAEKITKVLDESLFLSASELIIPVDDQLIILAKALPARVIVLTQDMALKNKLIQKKVSVIQLGSKKDKLHIPI